MGGRVRLAKEGKKWYVLYSLCYMCLDCNWVRILSGDIPERLYLINLSPKKGLQPGKELLFQKSGYLKLNFKSNKEK